MGVTVGVAALVIVLSVFNGFDGVIKSLINSFDPDIKISLAEGKTFLPEEIPLDSIRNTKGVLYVSEVVEENSLVRYDNRQFIATIKGVDEEFIHVTGIDSMIREGEFILQEGDKNFAIPGFGVAYSLRIGLNFIKPLIFYVPKRTGNFDMINPENSFNRIAVFPSGIFSIEQDYDSEYILLPIRVARNLLDYSSEISSLEIKLDDNADMGIIQKKLEELIGDQFLVQNRNQLNEVFYRIMKSEKWATFFILTLILIIASFNITASLTMLIIDKKEDIRTLLNLGASEKLIRRIFLVEGWLISILGSVAGIVAGTIISLLQQHFEFIKISGSGTFVIDAYPVDFQFPDILLIWLTVLFIGLITAWIPSKRIGSADALTES